MTSKASCVCIALVAFLLAPVRGQVAPPPPPAPPGEADPTELMRQMGVDEGGVLFLKLMSEALGADMGQMMLLMMLADKGEIDEDLIGVMLFAKALGGGAKQPIALVEGNKLLVIEDGMVYRINTETMEVEGSVAYRAKKGAGMLADLMPLIAQARGKAQGAACLSRIRQLCISAMQYAQEGDAILPTEQWPDQLAPYVKDRALYACPLAPEKPIGYVLNETVAGAPLPDIKRPAETVLFFESDPGANAPIGGPDAVLAQPRHDGQVVVGFVDGHAERVPPERLRELLGQDPFK